jgi:hypothetical protein
MGTLRIGLEQGGGGRGGRGVAGCDSPSSLIGRGHGAPAPFGMSCQG